MTSPFALTAGFVFLAVFAQTPPVHAASSALPVKDGRPLVASVDDDAVWLDELVMQLEGGADTARLLDGRATSQELELLERMITVRLLVREAAGMGIAEIGEIRKEVDVMSRSMLREVLMETLVKHIAPDEAAVEKEFRTLARQWKTASLLFQDEAAAKQAREDVAGGAAFDDVAAKAIAAKLARSEGDDQYHGRKEYLPPVAAALETLEIGQTSPPVQIAPGFVIVKVVDMRYPEDAAMRSEARATVLARQRQAELAVREQALQDENVVVRKDVLDGLDYEAKEPTFEALLTDTRVVAEIKDAAPVTVGDLTDYMRMQFYHPGEDSGRGKRLNARKQAAFDATVMRRVLNAEALRRGIDKTTAYTDRLNAFEDSLVFNAFVQRVIAPENKMREEEVKSYYQAHLKDYSFPAMMKLRSLAFSTRAGAEAAIEKLRGGADFAWLAANAADQIEPSARSLPPSDGRPVMVSSLPDGAQQALADAKTGDVRLYPSPDGQFYALAVQEVVPPAARPYDEVRQEIAGKLYGEKLNKSIEDYAAKLRAASKVSVYLKKAE